MSHLSFFPPRKLALGCLGLQLMLASFRTADAQAHPHPEHLTEHTVAERIAYEGPVMQGAEAGVEAMEAQAKSLRGRLFPSLHVGLQPAYFRTDLSLLLGQNTLKLSHGLTNLLSVTAAQPLLGLLHLSYDFRAAKLFAASEKHRAHATLMDVLASAHTQYLRLLLARAIEETEQASMRDLLAQAEEARARARSGTLTRADVLRIEVAAKQAEQAVLEATAMAVSLEASLKEQLGIASTDESVTFAQKLDADRPLWAPTREEARAQALETQPMLLAARAAAAANALSSRARAFALLPEVSISASYLRADNRIENGAHQGLNIGFAGLKLDWAVWDFGATYYGHKAASARARSARAKAIEVQQSVASNAAAKHATLVARVHGIEVANEGLVSALEAYRVMVAMRNVGEATTTDLLDAQAALTKSRASAIRARHEAAIAEVEMNQALGVLGQKHATRRLPQADHEAKWVEESNN